MALAHPLASRKAVASSGRADLPERLRAETAMAHASVECALDLSWMLGSIDRYRAMLGRFFGFFAVVEPRLEEMLPDGSFYPARRKLPLLSDDLLALGASEAAVARLPLCSWSVPASNRQEALGVLYVLEGATLGGAIIAREITRHLGDAAPARYFNAYGSRRGRMWNDFRARLTEAEGPGDDRLVEAAKASFGALENWLAEASWRSRWTPYPQ